MKMSYDLMFIRSDANAIVCMEYSTLYFEIGNICRIFEYIEMVVPWFISFTTAVPVVKSCIFNCVIYRLRI